MSDDGLAAREAGRIARRAASKPPSDRDVADRDVTERVVGRARSRATPADSRSISGVAGEIRAARQSASGREEPSDEVGWNVAGRMQAIDYLFGAIYLLMTARLLLAIVGAAPAGTLARFITSLTDPLYAPFRSLVGIPEVDGGGTLALPILIALVGYMLLHATISGLVRATRRQPTVL